MDLLISWWHGLAVAERFVVFLVAWALIFGSLLYKVVGGKRPPDSG